VGYALRKKSEAVLRLKDFKALIERIRNTTGNDDIRLKRITSDGGGEFWAGEDHSNKRAQGAWLKELGTGVRHTVTSAGCPQHNGLAERMNGIIFGAANSMLSHSHLTEPFWELAADYSVCIRNRVPISALGWKTPHELVFGKKPRLNMVKVFGCDAYVHDTTAGTIEEKAWRGIFVGLCDDRHGFLVMDPDTREVRTYYHVRFVEGMSDRQSYLRAHDDRVGEDTISKPDLVDLPGGSVALEDRIRRESVRKLYAKPGDLPPSGYDLTVANRAGVDPGAHPGDLSDGDGREDDPGGVSGTSVSDTLEVLDSGGGGAPSAPPHGEPLEIMEGPLSSKSLAIAAERAHRERSGSSLKRPVRLIPPGDPVKLTEADRVFLQKAMEGDFPVSFLPNPKRQGTLSHKRYSRYMHAATLREALQLGAKGTTRQYLSSGSDIAWDYARGNIIFPQHESAEVAHYVHASIFEDFGAESAYCAMSPELYSLPTGEFHETMRTVFPPEEPVDFLSSAFEMKKFSCVELFKVLLCESTGDIPAECSVPKNPRQAVTGPCGEHWRASMNSELSGLTEAHTYEPIDRCEAETLYQEYLATLPPGRERKAFKALPCTWVYRIKFDSRGKPYKLKSRICVRGDLAVEGLHFNEIFSPTVSLESVRTMLSVAAAQNMDVYQLDVQQAFLNAEVPPGPPIFIYYPPECSAPRGTDGAPKLLRLKKMLYGLPHSPKAWTDRFDEVVRQPRVYDGHPFQMRQLDADMCVYQCTLEVGGERQQILCSFYVDDVLICSTSVSLREWFVEQLANVFPINTLESGQAEWLLGMKIDIHRDQSGVIDTISLTQESHIDKLVAHVFPDGATHSKGKTRTPLDHLRRLPKLEAPTVGVDKCVNGRSYRSVVGSCLWVALCTRPDIAFAVGALARHSNAPGEEHCEQLLRVVRYLDSTRGLGLTYHRPRFPEEDGLIYCYVDADFCGNHDLKSTTGYFVGLHGAPIVWSSKLQTITAQSTAESEVIAACAAAKEVVHARTLMEDIGYTATLTIPTKVFEDNASCTAMASKQKSRKNAKHFVRRVRSLNEYVCGGVVEFIQTPSKEQLADILTKALEPVQFEVLRDRLLNVGASQLFEHVKGGGVAIHTASQLENSAHYVTSPTAATHKEAYAASLATARSASRERELSSSSGGGINWILALATSKESRSSLTQRSNADGDLFGATLRTHYRLIGPLCPHRHACVWNTKLPQTQSTKRIGSKWDPLLWAEYERYHTTVQPGSGARV